MSPIVNEQAGKQTRQADRSENTGLPTIWKVMFAPTTDEDSDIVVGDIEWPDGFYYPRGERGAPQTVWTVSEPKEHMTVPGYLLTGSRDLPLGDPLLKQLEGISYKSIRRKAEMIAMSGITDPASIIEHLGELDEYPLCAYRLRWELDDMDIFIDPNGGKPARSGGGGSSITGGSKTSQQRKEKKKPEAPAKPLTPVETLSKQLLPLGQFAHALNPGEAKRTDVADTFDFLLNNSALAAQAASASLQPGEKIALSWALSVHEGHPLLGDGSKPAAGAQLVDPSVLQSFLIQEKNIPQSYWYTQQRIAREQGYGNMELTQRRIQQHVQMLQREQRASLIAWIEYLRESDYPLWYQILVIHSVLDLGAFQEGEEGGKFPRRTSSSVSPYPELDRESLALLFTALSRQAAGEEVGDLPFEITPEVQDLIKNGNWSRLYERSVVQQKRNRLARGVDATDGKWIKYEKSDKPEDGQRLADSLAGYGTGWCTAGAETAQQQLSRGDFYIYCTPDTNGEYCVPRSAVRMQGENVGEIRGVAEGQNLEQDMEGVVADFTKDLPGSEAYSRKIVNMQRVKEIEERIENEDHLDPASRLFLSGVLGEVKGFGYREDPRVKELRDWLPEFDIAEDVLHYIRINNNHIKGDLLLGNINTYIDLPENLHVDGDFTLSTANLESDEIPRLPAGLRVGGGLDLNRAEITQLPDDIQVGGSLNLRGTKITELPKDLHVRGDLDISFTKIAQLPENFSVDGDLNIAGTEITQLPKDLHVRGEFSMGYTKITQLPAGFQADGNLRLAESKITQLPDDLHVKGYLDISNTDVTQLPAGLQVDGDVSIRKTKITRLPDEFHVKGSLDISSSQISQLPKGLQVDKKLSMIKTSITHLPEGLRVGTSLDLSYTPITQLPDDIHIGRNLELSGSKITQLPKNLHVRGDLGLNDTPITQLPEGLHVEGSFNIGKTSITQLPKGFRVDTNLDLTDTLITQLSDDIHIGGSLDLRGSKITQLPKNLHIRGSLNLKYTPITQLPEGLHVEGRLDIGETSITHLPKDLHVRGSLNLNETLVTQLPENLYIGEDLIVKQGTIIPQSAQIEGDIIYA